MKIVNYIICLLIFTIICIGVYMLVYTHKELVVNETSVTLKENEQKYLSAYVSGDDKATIKYESTNPYIASVDENGLITGISEGSTIIKIIYEKNVVECSVTIVKVVNEKKITNVSFPKNNLMIGVGDSYKLDYILEPNYEYETIEFKTNNPDVLKVDDNGNITGLKQGNAIINVTVNNAITTDLNVYVFNNVSTKYVDLPKAIVVVSNIILEVDEEKELSVGLLPESTDKNFISYSSSDETVCTYQSGKIKGIKEGTCNIIIESINDIKKTVNVTVNKKIINVQSIVVTSGQNISLTIGQTSQIKYEVWPSNATDKAIYFESSDSKIATVSSDGVIKAIASGEAIIVLRTGDSNHFSYVKVTIQSNASGGNGGGNTGSSCYYIDPVLGKDGSNNGCLNTSNSFFNSCFMGSKDLILQGGIQSITVGVGETKTIRVSLPGCGIFQKYTRISLDGEHNLTTQELIWPQYISQCFNSVSGDGSFVWTITGKQRGTTQASVTVQYEAKDPSVGGTCVGNVKNMVMINVIVT